MRVKRFDEFLNENQKVNERIDWEAIPVLGGWIKAKRERKEAEAKAKAEKEDKELREHSARLMKRIEKEYIQYRKSIERNFAATPEIIEDKLMYLEHFMWSCIMSENGWDADEIKKIISAGKWEQVMKDVFDPKKNPYGCAWPEWVWYEDLKPDLRGLEKDITYAKGYAKEYK